MGRGLEVTIRREAMVTPSEATPERILWNSNVDLVIPRMHTQSVYFYRNEERSPDFLSHQTLATALAKTLVPFYPMAGRLRRSSEAGRVEINCNAQGVLLVEAQADAAVADFGEFAPDPRFKQLVPQVDYSQDIASFPLLVLQVTFFRCGGASLGVGMQHHIADGMSGIHCINTWSEMARGIPLRVQPFIDRTLLKANSPPAPKYPHIEYQPPPRLLQRENGHGNQSLRVANGKNSRSRHGENGNGIHVGNGKSPGENGTRGVAGNGTRHTNGNSNGTNGSHHDKQNGNGTNGSHHDTQNGNGTNGSHHDTQNGNSTNGSHHDTQNGNGTNGSHHDKQNGNGTNGSHHDKQNGNGTNGFHHDKQDGNGTNGSHHDKQNGNGTNGSHHETQNGNGTNGFHHDKQDGNGTNGSHHDTQNGNGTNGFHHDKQDGNGTNGLHHDNQDGNGNGVHHGNGKGNGNGIVAHLGNGKSSGHGEKLTNGKSVQEDAAMAVRVFRFTKEQLATLKQMGRTDDVLFSSYEMLSGHIWKCVTQARELDDAQETKLFVATDGRSRLVPPLPPGYFGNVIFTCTPIASAGELVHNPVTYAARKIHDALSRMNDEYLRSALDYLELQEDVSKLVRGAHHFNSPNLGITSWARMPVYECDFGWGRPVFMGPAAIAYEGLAFVLSSPVADGSLSLSLGLRPDHMATFEKLVLAI